MAADPSSPQNKRVLVVEDEGLLALDLMYVLADAGFTPVGPASTVVQALEMIEQHELVAAMLDVRLAGELVWPVAQALQDRNVGFAFLSGTDAVSCPPAFQSAPFLMKPVVADDVLQVIAAICGAR